MKLIRDTSVKQKLVLSGMVPAAVAVVLVAVTVGWYLRVEVRRESVASLTAIATIIGDNSAAALTFGDRSDAEAVLGALRARASVASAAIYDENAEIFATFQRDSAALGRRRAPARAPEEGVRFVGGDLVLTQPILLDGRRTGTTHIVSDMVDLNALLRRIAITAALVIVLALIVAFGLSSVLHRLISTPISRLARAARQVSEHEDYSVRIESSGSDELGRLTVAFNDMLNQIERRDTLLRENEAYFRSLIEHSSDVITVIGADSKIRYQSPSLERVLGYPTEEHSGRSVFDLVHDEHREVLAGAIAEGFAEPGTPRTFIARFRHRDGTWRDLEEVLTVHVSEEGEEFAVIHARDITERRRMEQERERLNAQLQQAQKMEAVGQLTGGVAHDFNNLLTVILGNLELMITESDDDSERNILVKEAIRAADRGAALTHRLLAFSRKQSLNPTVVDLRRLVGGMTELLRRTLGETILIDSPIGVDLWACEADPAQLENVLLNLAINSRDAMPDGGRLTIEVANAYLDHHYAAMHPEVGAGPYVMLSVTDTGIGMDSQVLQQAFDPFFTTKGVGQGSGLGLSMVYGFAKQSGGHVSLDSEVGKGTVAKLYLPKAWTEAPETDAVAAHEGEPRATGEKVLVVADDAGAREFAVEVLDRMGYRTMEAMDGASALAVLEKTEDVALLFTDMILPGGMDGVELAVEAERMRPHIKILHASGPTRDSATEDRLLGSGHQRSEKPFTQTSLAGDVRRALSGGVS